MSSSINQVASPAQAVFSPPSEALPKQTSATLDQAVAADSSAANKPSDVIPSAATPDTKTALDQLDKAVSKANEFLQSQTSLNLQFSVDKDINRTVVKVVDPSTKEVVRQIPSKEVIEIAKSLDRLQGLLLKDKA
ncbi:MAG: flagellar protein FlaG [Burkholderiales bacterium]